MTSSVEIPVIEQSRYSKPSLVLLNDIPNAEILNQDEICENFESNRHASFSDDERDIGTPVDKPEFYSDLPYRRARRYAIDYCPVNFTNDAHHHSDDNEEDNCSNLVSADGDLISENDWVDKVNTENAVCYETTAVKRGETEENEPSEEGLTEDMSGILDQVRDTEFINRKSKYMWGIIDEMDTSDLQVEESNEISIYYSFTKACHSLSNLALVPAQVSSSSTAESLTFPNHTPAIKPITAKRLLPELERCYAYMHGGHDLSDAPIICLPHFSDLRDVSEEAFRDVILYLTSVTSACSADVGFVLVIDRRKDKWSSVKAVLIRLAAFFPGCLRMVLVLRPSGFFQGAIADIGFRWKRVEFAMKIVMLSSLDELFTYIEPKQLTREFGGQFEYEHKAWIRNRMLLEDFTSHATDIGRSLEAYGTKLAETEFPNDFLSTQLTINEQQTSTNDHKEKIDGLLKAAIALKATIETPLGGSALSESANKFETETLHSIMALIEETDIAFENFWKQHETKLKECLELRQFEQEYREARIELNTLSSWLDSQSNNLASSISWVESMIKEAEMMEESFLECNTRCVALAKVGETLTNNNHYAVDCIAPKCDELVRLSASLLQSFESRRTFLNETLSALTRIEELNNWCDQAMSILAGQVIEKTQSFDGAKRALTELENFFETENKPEAISTDSVPNDSQSATQTVNNRLEEVKQLYSKRRASLKKLTTKHGERPVQMVEPSKKTTDVSQQSGNEKDQQKRNATSLSSSPSKSPNFVSTNSSQTTLKSQHVMNELLSTEKVYVDELKNIVEGYGNAIDNPEFADIVPKELVGNKSVLLGNMEDIQNFHSNVFLGELEECKDAPSTVGKCFLKRKDEFAIYSQYCQNSAKSEHLRSRIGEQHPFLLECQRKLGHRLPLSAYLLKPVQRITKYQLLLQQILKHSNSHIKELEGAVDAMLAVLKSVNDSMHQLAIIGYQGDFKALGKLLMQGSFSMQIEHKKTKVKNLTRPRFSKTLQRHLFLYEKELLICKQQSCDTSNPDGSSNNKQSFVLSSGNRGHIYQYKNSLKMNAAGITEKIKGDARKFEIWYQGREDVYTLLSSSIVSKQEWVREIKKALLSQPKSEITPQSNPPEKVSKVKRSQSLNRKSRSAQSRTHENQLKQQQNNKTEKNEETKKKSTLGRSASMGKGKDKTFKRKNMDVTSSTSKETNNEVSDAKRKSHSLPRLLDPPHHSSDTEDSIDLTTTSSGCKFVVIKERSEVLDEGEVVLHIGDVAEIIETGKEGWVKIRIDRCGSEGWAPTSHITSMSDASSFESVSSFVSN